MAHRKRHTALKALELLQKIHEDDSDAKSGAESDKSVYHLDQDNRDDSESESSSGESLVSESSHSKISDFEDNKTNSETDEDHVYRIIQHALQLQLKLLGIFWSQIKTIPEGDLATTLSEKLLGHLLKHTVVLSKNRFAVHRTYLLMKVCCVIYKDVLKKKLEEFHKQTIGACRYMN